MFACGERIENHVGATLAVARITKFRPKCDMPISSRQPLRPCGAPPLAQGEAMVDLRPASRRPHVRATEYDWYHVGRGNARLMSQGDCRGQPVTHPAEGTRGEFCPPCRTCRLRAGTETCPQTPRLRRKRVCLFRPRRRNPAFPLPPFFEGQETFLSARGKKSFLIRAAYPCEQVNEFL